MISEGRGEALAEYCVASLFSDTRVERRQALVAARAAQPFMVMGCTLREHVAIAGASSDNNAVRDPVAEAFAYAASPPTKTKPPRAGRPDPRPG